MHMCVLVDLQSWFCIHKQPAIVAIEHCTRWHLLHLPLEYQANIRPGWANVTAQSCTYDETDQAGNTGFITVVSRPYQGQCYSDVREHQASMSDRCQAASPAFQATSQGHITGNITAQRYDIRVSHIMIHLCHDMSLIYQCSIFSKYH